MKHKLSACILISTLAYTVHGTQHTILIPGTQHTQYNTSPWYTARNTILVPGKQLTHNTIPVNGTQRLVQYLVHN